MVQLGQCSNIGAVAGCVYVNYFGFSIAVFAIIFPLIKCTKRIHIYVFGKPQANPAMESTGLAS